jgi:parvulin-like peptidyl-prolyl isomerase
MLRRRSRRAARKPCVEGPNCAFATGSRRIFSTPAPPRPWFASCTASARRLRNGDPMGRTLLSATLCSALWLCPPALRAAPKAAGSDVYALVDGPSGAVKASLFSTEQASLPIAQVGARTITLAELADALAASHRAHGGGAPQKSGRKKDFTPVLDRLIGLRLVVQEAQAMGLDELDEVKKAIADSQTATLRNELQRRALKGVKADAAEVKSLFEDAVRQWKIKSALFEKEEDAKALVAAAGAGGSFDALVQKAVEEKKATGGAAAQWFAPAMQMLPQIVQAAGSLKKGQVSAPIKVEKGFAVLRVEDVRYPENKKAREQAREQALASKKKVVLKAYFDRLVKRYAAVDETLLASLDFETKEPGFDGLGKDERRLAKIKGGKDILVKDLTGELRSAFFHDIKHAIESKKVNRRKAEAFDALLSRELVALEVARQKIAESAAYRKAVARARDELIFGAFLEKVLIPDVKVTEGDVKRYYELHQKEFTYPAFYRLQSLSFTTQKAAQAALAQLKAGTDFNWLKQNAEGLVAEGKRAVELDGEVISGRGLTPEVAKAITGARNGDLRKLEVSEQHVVIRVLNVTPPAPQPYPETRETIAPRVQQEMVNKALLDWIDKLRKAHEVKIFITRIVS